MDERVLMFSVLGTPRPKPSVRKGAAGAFTVKVKREANIWREAVRRAAREAVDTLVRGGHRVEWLLEAVSVEREYRFAVNGAQIDRLGRAHKVKPDADNLDKLLFDAMQDAGCLRGGDQRVSGGEPRKVWARQAGVWVVVRPNEGRVESVEDLRGPALFG